MENYINSRLNRRNCYSFSLSGLGDATAVTTNNEWKNIANRSITIESGSYSYIYWLKSTWTQPSYQFGSRLVIGSYFGDNF